MIYSSLIILHRLLQANFMSFITFLKVSRPHTMLPKHEISIGCCALIIIIDRICCISTGSKYHSSWASTWSKWSNALLNCWPNSQTTNTSAIAQKPQKIASNSITESIVLFVWKSKSISKLDSMILSVEPQLQDRISRSASRTLVSVKIPHIWRYDFEVAVLLIKS